MGSFFQLAAALADLPSLPTQRREGSLAVAGVKTSTPSRGPVAAGTMCVARYGACAAQLAGGGRS